MNLSTLTVAAAVALATAGCGMMRDNSTGGGTYGEAGTGGTSTAAANGTATNYERYGRVAALDTVSTSSGERPRFGIGTVIGAVAGGLLGHQVGSGSGQTAATVAGAVAGGAAGHAIGDGGSSSEAQRVTVNMNTGGQVTVVQPRNANLSEGMQVMIVGSGESARVVPR